MKIKKWNLWGIALVVIAVLRLVFTYVFMNLAMTKLDIKILENYQQISRILAPALSLVCFIGMYATYRMAIKDLKERKEALEGKFVFLSIIVYFVIKCIFDTITAFVWESNTLYLGQQIAKMRGEEIMLGHPSGMLTLIYIALGLLQVIVVTIVGIVWNKKYQGLVDNSTSSVV